MQRSKVIQPEIKLVGIKIRTHNKNEQDPAHAKIAPTALQYYREGLAELIHHRANPGTTYCVYTDYASDFTGEYTFFIGEAVDSFRNIRSDMDKLIIPEQTYTKFTTEPGPMPMVVIEAWKQIWQMKEEDFSGERAYIADFEVYDDRATNNTQTVLDIFIGVK